MTIDTKRLATDAAYWDEVAETASHYCPSNKQFYDCRLHPCCIPRPQSEWVDGLPPVGCECEYEALHDWWIVKITAVGEKHILMNYGGVELCRCIKGSRFRPIPTKEQRDRDDVFSAIDEEVKGYNISIHCSAAIAKTVDAILSKYNLEPKS